MAPVLKRLRDGDPNTHATLRYALAKGVGEYVGHIGAPFRAVYVYGSAMSEASSPCSDIDIIIVVDRDRDEIGRLLRGVDVALVARFRVLVPSATRLRSLLDIRVVVGGTRLDDNGPGAPSSVLQDRPVCLWRFPLGGRGTSSRRSPGDPRETSVRVDEKVSHS